MLLAFQLALAAIYPLFLLIEEIQALQKGLFPFILNRQDAVKDRLYMLRIFRIIIPIGISAVLKEKAIITGILPGFLRSFRQILWFDDFFFNAVFNDRAKAAADILHLCLLPGECPDGHAPFSWFQFPLDMNKIS